MPLAWEKASKKVLGWSCKHHSVYTKQTPNQSFAKKILSRLGLDINLYC